MNKLIQIISLLADGTTHSGENLAEQLSVSRTAIWKRIQSLQRRGMVIHSVRGQGYRLGQPVELLERFKLEPLLDGKIRPLLKTLTLLTEAKSTNQYLLDKINNQDFHGHVTLAEYQSAGRGRRGRKWHAPFAGGICLSVSWYYDPAPQPLTLVSLGAGIAVIRALRRVGIKDAGLKWPNDIYWQGRKLGGVLVEAREESAGPCRLVLGIGVNFRFPGQPGRNNEHLDEQLIDQPWVDMAAIKQPLCSRNLFAAVLISETLQLLDDMATMYNSGSRIIAEWRRYDHMPGKRARMILPARTVDGCIIGIDPTGALLMDVKGKVERFNSGEINLKVQL